MVCRKGPIAFREGYPPHVVALEFYYTATFRKGCELLARVYLAWFGDRFDPGRSAYVASKVPRSSSDRIFALLNGTGVECNPQALILLEPHGFPLGLRHKITEVQSE